VVPYLLQQFPELAAKLSARGLNQEFFYPASAHSDLPAAATTKPRLVAELLDGLNVDIAEFGRRFGPMLNEVAGSSIAWRTDNGQLIAPVLSSAAASVQAAPDPPQAIASNPRANDAYGKGRDVPRQVLEDPSRAPPQGFTGFGDLYRALGDAADRAAAASVLADASKIVLFGATCQRTDAATCRAALTSAQIAQRAEAEAGGNSSSTLARNAAGWVAMAATFLDRVKNLVLEAVISGVMPGAIGYASFCVSLLAPVAAFLMMWPGRFLFGLQLTVGGQLFVGLWTVFYIVWDRVTAMGGDLAIAKAASGSLGSYGTLVTISTLGQLFIVAGYLALSALAFSIAFHSSGALERIANAGAAVGAAGIGAALAGTGRALNASLPNRPTASGSGAATRKPMPSSAGVGPIHRSNEVQVAGTPSRTPRRAATAARASAVPAKAARTATSLRARLPSVR
jgi:hypothetical protein